MADRGRGSHQIAQMAVMGKLALEPLRLRHQIFIADGAFEQRRERGRLRRLFQKPERMQVVYDRHRFVDASESGEHDRRSEVASVEKLAQQTEPVQARHDQIGNDHVRRRAPDLLQCVLAIFSGFNGIAEGCNHRRHAEALARIVVYHQNPRRSSLGNHATIL